MHSLLHLDDLGHYLPQGSLDLVWLEENPTIETRQRICSRARELGYQSVDLWCGDRSWPCLPRQKFLYYLWISGTEACVDYSQPVEKLYLCLNSQLKPHRIKTLERLNGLGIFDQGFVSFGGHNNLVWLGSETHPKNSLPVIELPMHYVNRSALSLVTESQIDPLDISEKTFQCLAVGQPFISIGSRYLHQTLFDMGFHPLPGIDYGFDSIEDFDTRLNMAIREIAKFARCDLNKLKQNFRRTVLLNQLTYKKLMQQLKFPISTQSVILGSKLREQIKNLKKLQKLYQ